MTLVKYLLGILLAGLIAWYGVFRLARWVTPW